MRLRVLVFFLLFAMYQHTALAQTVVRDDRHGFIVSMPCDPVEIKSPLNDRMLHLYNCYEGFGKNQSVYFVHANSSLDGKMIRYRMSDIDKAIKLEVIGSLLLLGGNEHNIKFRDSDKFVNSPAVEYYSDQLNNGMMAAGVSAFISGQHIRIGIVYSLSDKDQAQQALSMMLDTFSRK